MKQERQTIQHVGRVFCDILGTDLKWIKYLSYQLNVAELLGPRVAKGKAGPELKSDAIT
jgi:hypothetical protein